MGTPRTAQARRDAMFDWGGLAICDIVRSEWPDPQTTILDVGAGWGKYRDLLGEYPNVDACEVWWPNVHGEDLLNRYRQVFVKHIHNLVTSSAWSRMSYNVAIFGDVLEHMPRDTAVATLRSTLARCDDVLVLVPYEYEQDAEDGNPYEYHAQADLTPQLMASEYPMLRCVGAELKDGRPYKGLYRKAGWVT